MKPSKTLKQFFGALYIYSRAWTSHIGRTLQYEAKINTFVALHANKDLCDLELSEDKWSSIQLVASWLEKFRNVTTQMSATHWPMLSHTHTIFCGLQEHLCKSLQHLPSGINSCIQDGLIATHQKLSEYYYQFDQSPFYIWAAHMSVSFSNVPNLYFSSSQPKDYIWGLETQSCQRSWTSCRSQEVQGAARRILWQQLCYISCALWWFW